MTINDEDPRCGICTKPRSEHAELHHHFSESGELLPIDQGKRAALARQIASPAADGVLLRLIAMLARKGLLQEGELLEILGGTDARNPADRANVGSDHPPGDSEVTS